MAGIFGCVALGGVAYWNSLQPENRLRRARKALAAGQFQTALRESRRLLGVPGFEPHARLIVGLVRISEGRHLDALQELQHAAWDETTAVEALTSAAGCYYALGQYSETVRMARTALDRDPQAIDARRWLAAALYDLGQSTAAATELLAVAESVPGDFRAERLLGLIYKDHERFEDAVQHYRESLRRGPQQTDREQVKYELAECLIKLSRFDEALAALQQVEPDAPVLTLSAECHRGLGQVEDAERLVGQARELSPEYLPACLEQATQLLLLRRHEAALDLLLRAVGDAPYSSQAHYLLSSTYNRLGRRDLADTELQRSKEAQAREREFFELHDSASKHPRDAETRYRLGVLAGEVGKPELAPMWFRAALAIQPDHAAARAALEQATELQPGGPGRR